MGLEGRLDDAQKHLPQLPGHINAICVVYTGTTLRVLGELVPEVCQGLTGDYVDMTYRLEGHGWREMAESRFRAFPARQDYWLTAFSLGLWLLSDHVKQRRAETREFWRRVEEAKQNGGQLMR